MKSYKTVRVQTHVPFAGGVTATIEAVRGVRIFGQDGMIRIEHPSLGPTEIPMSNIACLVPDDEANNAAPAVATCTPPSPEPEPVITESSSALDGTREAIADEMPKRKPGRPRKV